MDSSRGTGSGPSVLDVVRSYHRYAPVYDRVFGAIYEHGRRELAASVPRVVEGHSLLEIGVGTGLTLPLYPENFDVTGVDICPDMLARAQRRVERELPGRDIQLKLMDGERLDFADGSFDCVVLAYVLPVTPHPDQLVAEVRRVCRKDGIIYVLNHFNGSRVWYVLELMVRPLAKFVGFRSDFSIDEHVMRHDWKVQSIQVVNLFGLSKLVTIRNA
jgi:phosphatidylethanolamine/phosphatidyl-N-methylethanolamine N-methyltransferase